MTRGQNQTLEALVKGERSQLTLRHLTSPQLITVKCSEPKLKVRSYYWGICT